MNKNHNTIFVFVILIALTYLECRILINLHTAFILENVKATVTPLIGHAWWKAWQNRYLAGWILDSIQKPPEEAYKIFAFVTCLAMNCITYFLYKEKNAK
jgi:hypothetical protein